MKTAMLFTPLALAGAAAAFLIVPEISDDVFEDDAFRALPIDAFIFDTPPTAVAQSVDVRCHDCRDPDTRLRLDFQVADGSRLLLNGFELYPSTNPWNYDLTAAEVQASGMGREHRLGYSLAVVPEATDAEQQMDVIGVELQVIEVGNRFVEGVPAVKVKLVQTAAGEMAIGRVDVAEVVDTVCETVWCRAKELVGDVLSSFGGGGGCSRGHHRHHSEAASDETLEDEWEEEDDFQVRPHAYRRPHWGRLLRNIMSHILLPVVMGITAGVGVAVIAMFVCALVVRLVMVFRGGRERRPWCKRRQRATKEDSAAEEKISLVDGQEDVLPPYEVGDQKN